MNIIIQSGIKEVIYLSNKYSESENNIASRRLFDECNITYKQIKFHNDNNIIIPLSF